MKKISFIIIFFVTFIAIASDKNIVCATSACTPDFTPINQYEKIYYSSIDAGTNNQDNINVSTVASESPRSLRFYVENNSKDSPKNITVDLSSKSQEFNSGDALLIGDYFNAINLKLNGYSGTTGKSASEICADKYLLGGSLGFGDYAKAEFQSKRIANQSLPTNKCTAADVDFLQQNNFSCDEDGYTEISKLDPVVSVKRFKGKTKCLGVGFKDVCVQKTVKVTCNWILKYESGYSTHESENITKNFTISEQEWLNKTDDQKKELCLDLTKGSDSDADSTNLVSNGTFNENADSWTLSGNIKYANGKIKTLVGPELKLTGSGWSTVGGKRAYSFVIGYTDLATKNSKGYTYTTVSTESNVSCSGLTCTAVFPYTTSEFKNNLSNDGLISLMKMKVTNTSGVSNIYDIAFKFESNGDYNTGYYKTNCEGSLESVQSDNPSYIINSFNSGYGDVCAAMKQQYLTTYQQMSMGGVYASTCYQNSWAPVNGCINNEATYSQYDGYCMFGTLVTGNLCLQSSPNIFYYSTISSVIKPKLSLESIGVAKKTLSTEANETYRVTGVFYSATEDKVVSSAGIRMSDNTGADLMSYLVPTNGDVVVQNGETLTLDDNGIKTFNSLYVQSGGTLILNGNQFHTIYAKKFIQIDGQIKTALNNYSWNRNVSTKTLFDGTIVDLVSQMSTGGGSGGNGGKGGDGGDGYYNRGGYTAYGNGGGGGCWQIWYAGNSASESCGGAGQLGNNPGGCIGENNSANATIVNGDGCGSGGGGGARGAHSGSLIIVTPELRGSGSIKLRGQAGGIGMTAGYGYSKDMCDSMILAGTSVVSNSDGSCTMYSGGGSGGGGAGGSGGSLYIKADQNTLEFDLSGGSGGRSGYSGNGGRRGGSGAAGSAGVFVFDEIKYFAKQKFDDKSISQADTANFNDDTYSYPLTSYLTTRIPHYFDFTFVAKSNSTNIELYQYVPNTPGYFDNIEVKKVNPNSGPPVKPNGTVANYQGIDGLGYFDMPTVPTAELTTIGYDSSSLELLTGSSWSIAFTDLGADCPLFYTKIPDKTNYLTSIIAYDPNDDQCDDVSIPQDPNGVLVWKNIGIDRKLEFGYETISCRIDNCPVQNVVQTFDKILMELNVGVGISGTQQGEGLLFTYDYNSASLQSTIGQPGYVGANDIPVYSTERICAKVQDAVSESSTSDYAANPSVNFKRYQWQALKVSGEDTIPKSPTDNKKSIHLFKKIDSSVRYLLKQELL